MILKNFWTFGKKNLFEYSNLDELILAKKKGIYGFLIHRPMT